MAFPHLTSNHVRIDAPQDRNLDPLLGKKTRDDVAETLISSGAGDGSLHMKGTGDAAARLRTFKRATTGRFLPSRSRWRAARIFDGMALLMLRRVSLAPVRAFDRVVASILRMLAMT